MSNQATTSTFDLLNSKKINERSKNILKDQKRSKRIYLSIWAREYISNHDLSIKNFSGQYSFKILDQKHQQAVRYQLRRQTQKTSRVGERRKEKIKDPFFFNLASFLVVAMTEFLIITLSAKFYQTIGVSLITAKILAVSVESFYMLLSLGNTPSHKIIRYSFLACSIFTVAFSTYQKDNSVQNFVNNIQVKKETLNNKLATVGQQIDQYQKEKENILKSMTVYQNFGMVTRGIKMLRKDTETNQLNLEHALKQKELILEQINNYNQSSLGTNIFSWKAVKIAKLETWVVIAIYFLIQLATSIFIKDSLSIFQYLFPGRRRGLLRSLKEGLMGT